MTGAACPGDLLPDRRDRLSVDQRVNPPDPDAGGLVAMVGSAGAGRRGLIVAAVVVVAVSLVSGGPVFGALAVVVLAALVGGAALVARAPYAGLLVIPAGAPILLVEVAGGLTLVHVLSIAAIATVVIGLVVRGVPVPVPATMVAALVFIAALGLTVLTSLEPGRSAPAFVYYFLGWAVAGAAAIVVAINRMALVWMLRAWSVGALISITPALLTGGFGGVRYGGALVEGRATGIFAQPNDFGEYAMMTVFVALALVTLRRGWWDRILGLAAVSVALIAVPASLSRGTWVGLVVGLLVVGLLAPRIGIGILAIGVAGVAGLWTATVAGSSWAAGMALRAGSVFNGSTNPEDHREQIWEQAQSVWWAHPVTGVGPGEFRSVSRSVGSSIAPDGAYHAHNSVLQFGAEGGIVVLVALGATVLTLIAVVVGAVLQAGLRNRQPGTRVDSRATVLLFGALAGIAAHSMVDFVYTNPMLLALAWLLFGITVGSAHRLRAGRRNE